MEQIENCSLLEAIEHCRTRSYSGAISFELDESSLTLWFVRGNLAHAERSNGDVGWKAIEATSSNTIATIHRNDGELPPERTIRVDTSRLLKAMTSTQSGSPQRAMRVPVPLHARLQQKFSELRLRITGLKSFETMQTPVGVNAEGEGSNENSDRTILERDPRGSKWSHVTGDRRLVLRGDETITTAELMWAGSELWKELDSANRKATEDE